MLWVLNLAEGLAFLGLMIWFAVAFAREGKVSPEEEERASMRSSSWPSQE